MRKKIKLNIRLHSIENLNIGTRRLNLSRQPTLMQSAIRKGMHGDFGLDDVTGNLVVQQQKPDDPISKLERLSALKDKGMISDKEFEAVKTRLLSEI